MTLLSTVLQVELEFENVGFCGGRKTGLPREKPSQQGREPTTNSTCPGHIGARRVLSPLSHPRSSQRGSATKVLDNKSDLGLLVMARQSSLSVNFTTYLGQFSFQFQNLFHLLSCCISTSEQLPNLSHILQVGQPGLQNKEN